MLACIINALLFLCLLWWYYKKHRHVNYVFVVIALYAAVATCGIGYYWELYDIPVQVTMLPFIYLFITSLILFRPLIKEGHKSIELSSINIPSDFEIIVFLYVVSSIISLYNIWTDVVSHIVSGDWQSVKVDAYSGNRAGLGAFVSYLGAFAQYFRYAIYPYCFYCFCRPEKSFFKASIILILSITASLFQYLMMAYRGGVFSILILLLISFLMFFSSIPKNRKKLLFVLGGLTAFVLLGITISITNSRFENSTTTTPWESLFSYFGQPMINFNGGIANVATSYMGGKYFFMSAWGLDKSDFWIDSKYNTFTNNGSDFDTLIGCFYLDFGPIITLLIFLGVSWVINRLLRRKKKSWATLYILMFYLDMLVAGVFHGPSYLSQIVSNVVIIYFMILLIEKKNGCKSSSMLS